MAFGDTLGFRAIPLSTGSKVSAPLRNVRNTEAFHLGQIETERVGQQCPQLGSVGESGGMGFVAALDREIAVHYGDAALRREGTQHEAVYEHGARMGRGEVVPHFEVHGMFPFERGYPGVDTPLGGLRLEHPAGAFPRYVVGAFEETGLSRVVQWNGESRGESAESRIDREDTLRERNRKKHMRTG